MIILPAIDIKGGKCVRLFQGNFDEVKSNENVIEAYLGKGLNVRKEDHI